ncbi:bacteriorhodopsin-like [Candidatus Synchoanobacter obligatus]|uniref:Bacteriorhodopsin-like n=1 Tax=Candidatus Synchoanobacter obligatus TaxID=2919597 RepID=A0ABT1L4L3_9GAMM|nr:bacteriorhodopsin-like [Candidatus Synchoanobacter obligatus]MCP8352117.1 bacteriorhodopsin-like [Candidatus Synchoanobacter obligatus]
MAMLNPYDLVGVSFWLATAAMMATTVFLFVERQSVAPHWQLSVTVAGLVTLIAFFHYLYMRDVWVATQSTPIVYRYVDWFLTVPLQFVEFYFILAAVSRVSAGFFWKLLLASIVMLGSGYVGEAGMYDATWSFVVGMLAWFYILYLIWFGEGVKAQKSSGNSAASFAYAAIRLIVTFGWAIYPLGYAFGVLSPSIDQNSLNVIYNFADIVNKIAFGLFVWSAAYRDTGVASHHVS